MLRARVPWIALVALALAAAALLVVVLVDRVGRAPDPLEPANPAAVVPDVVGDPRRPAPDWRPYSDDSPFNRPLPKRPRVDPRSAQMVGKLVLDGPPDTLLTFDGTNERNRQDDFARPIYFARDGDPSYRVVCVDPRYPCRAGGADVRIPAGARAAGGSDGHLTVVDGGTEWSFFDVQGKRPTRGELRVRNGSGVPITGDGLDAGGGAAGFGGLAGRIRWEPFRKAILERTSLPFALFMTVRCARAEAFVAPAVSGEDKRACADQQDRAEMGRRFWLDMSAAEIEALEVPEWLKVIARTMARYGAVVGDQGGSSWGLQFESPEGFLAMGRRNPFARYATRRPGHTVHGGGAHGFLLREGVPWSDRLRALAVPRSSP